MPYLSRSIFLCRSGHSNRVRIANAVHLCLEIFPAENFELGALDDVSFHRVQKVDDVADQAVIPNIIVTRAFVNQHLFRLGSDAI